VWLDKRTPLQSERTPPSQAMMRGIALQPVIARAYELQNDVSLMPEAFAVSDEYPFMAATPDARILGQNRHIQIKTHLRFLEDEYGEAGSDDVPLHEFTQVTHECAVLGTQEAELVVLFATEPMFEMLEWAWSNFSNSPKEADEVALYALNSMDYRQYTIKRDPDLEKDLVAALKEFYEKHIVGGEMPPSSPVLKDSGFMRTATEDERSLIQALKNGYLTNKTGLEQMEMAKEQLIHSIGSDTGIDSDIGKVSYKLAKSGVVSWKKVAEEFHQLLLSQHAVTYEYFDRVVKEHTSVPKRSFVYPWARWKKEL
jgi:predicted phage-related endonuclease